MQESARTARAYILSRAEELGIDRERIKNHGVHPARARRRYAERRPLGRHYDRYRDGLAVRRHPRSAPIRL